LPQSRKTHGQVVEDLAMRIVSNEYAEGTNLNQSKLCAELDVSMTMLREVLRVLAAKGLIQSRQKRGTVVLPRSSWHLLDPDCMRWRGAASSDPGLIDELVELRASLERGAARTAAEHATESDLAGLAAALDAMEEATDVEAAAAADIAFHRHLILATNNELFAQTAQVIAIGLAKHKRFANYANLSDLVTSHRAVLNAILAHDPAAAERAMRALTDQC
jgi:GntR family transcriptional regulator, galactonate operon transcriptional repressor